MPFNTGSAVLVSMPNFVVKRILVPGDEIFDTIVNEAADVICSEDGPYGAAKQGVRNNAQAHGVATAILLGLGLSAPWVPVAVAVGLIVVDVGIQRICEYRAVHPQTADISFSDLLDDPVPA